MENCDPSLQLIFILRCLLDYRLRLVPSVRRHHLNCVSASLPPCHRRSFRSGSNTVTNHPPSPPLQHPRTAGATNRRPGSPRHHRRRRLAQKSGLEALPSLPQRRGPRHAARPAGEPLRAPCQRRQRFPREGRREAQAARTGPDPECRPTGRARAGKHCRGHEGDAGGAERRRGRRREAL